MLESLAALVKLNYGKRHGDYHCEVTVSHGRAFGDRPEEYDMAQNTRQRINCMLRCIRIIQFIQKIRGGVAWDVLNVASPYQILH